MGNFFSCSDAKEAKPLLSETKKAEGERKEENKKEDPPKEGISISLYRCPLFISSQSK